MKNLAIVNKLTRTANRAGLTLKKYSPEILMVAGIAGTVVSAVMACKATTKLSEVLEESKEDLDTIHGYIEEKGYSEVYTEADGKKDLASVYVHSGLKVAKLYAPAVMTGVVSISAILASNNILRKRNVALAAAYTAIDSSFKEYRGRVIDRFGKEVDRELKYNIKAKEFEETVVDEKGEEKTVTKKVAVADPNTYSDYAKFFDEGCKGWCKDPELNLMFLRRMQEQANRELKRRGHLFLNEVYDMLGIQRTTLGQVAGWIYDEKNPIGDNFVDFGIYDMNREKCRDFVNGYERVILLDFNCDGNIMKYI